MTDAIRPALTPEEWESVRFDSIFHKGDGPLTGVGISYTNGTLRTGRLCNAFAPVALVALLNHALPDGHPLKITREDVVQLQAEAVRARFAESTGDNAGMSRIDCGDMERLADKLAALLPPEEAA